MPDINYLAVLVSGIAAMVVGYLWFGPLFGKKWMRSNGMDQWSDEKRREAMKSMNSAYLVTFVLALVQAWVLAGVIWFMSNAGSVDITTASGLKAGFMMWLGFVLPVKYGDKAWSSKKFETIVIELGNSLVTLLVMGIILALWR